MLHKKKPSFLKKTRRAAFPLSFGSSKIKERTGTQQKKDDLVLHTRVANVIDETKREARTSIS